MPGWLLTRTFVRIFIHWMSHTMKWSIFLHYSDVIMGAIASQNTSLTIVYSIDYSDTDQRKHQSSASLAFTRGIHRWPMNSPHKLPVTRKMFPFDDVIMKIIKIKSLWPFDAIWCYRRGSALIREIISCHEASSHYLNQCWLCIIQWASSTGLTS